ncbi:hypothetical protein H3T12_34385 [Streptomyces sp. GMR22]|nr:hypothetical protein [Streptomyces sp. GMR22]MBA6439443.1 hypothetical protein [Streptomyces sp. GMR22]
MPTLFPARRLPVPGASPLGPGLPLRFVQAGALLRQRDAQRDAQRDDASSAPEGGAPLRSIAEAASPAALLTARLRRGGPRRAAVRGRAQARPARASRSR